MNDNTRYRGVMLDLLDLTPVTTKAFDQYAANQPVEVVGFDRFEPIAEPYAVGQTPDGRTYVICNEGVGWEVSETKPLFLDLYLHGERQFSALPVVTVTLSLAEVLSLRTGQQVDLVDHVRVFGRRLEENFQNFYALFTRRNES